ncbi:MAG: hypothetical protein KGJ06_00035 [Pseudomonadota bacterium]|nr:hypothetical protein [Pseudomonadota bacterium]
MSFYKQPHRPFKKRDIEQYAASYDYPEPPKFKTKGFLTYDDLELIGMWKTRRQSRNYQKNDDDFVRDITRASFNKRSGEKFRIEVLTLLQGVHYPVASALLHVGYDDTYPIIDFRTLWSLWAIEPAHIKYTFELWSFYISACRKIAKDANVSVRTVDKALWQYSRQHQIQFLPENSF